MSMTWQAATAYDSKEEVGRGGCLSRDRVFVGELYGESKSFCSSGELKRLRDDEANCRGIWRRYGVRARFAMAVK